MEAHAGPGAYKDLVLFLTTAAVVVPLFRRWKVSPILGFLGAGVLLGPHGLGALSGELPWLRHFTVDNPDEIEQLAEFGVVFLLFMIGLELSWERLRLMRRFVFGLGAAQVSLCLAVIAAAAMALGQPLPTAAAIGAALALSSTAIVMQVLADQKRQHSQAGRATFSVLLFQDLAVAPILVTLAVLGKGDELSPRLLLAFAPAAVGLFALVVGARLLLRPMFRSVAKAKSEELFMAACLLVVIGAGVASALAGLSMALGEFVAGLLLAETEFRHEVEVTIEPFKGLLLGLFFVSVGIHLDLSRLIADPITILTIAVGMIVLNASVVMVLGRLFGLSRPAALESALLLAGGGEFAFVILSTAMAEGVVPPVVGQAVLVAATLSMMLIPALAWAAVRVNRQPPPKPADIAPEPPAATTPESPKVLIVGYGRVGRLVADMVSRHELGWIALERDARLVEAGRRAGDPIYFGDGSRPELLRRCGLDEAKALVVTMDDPDAVEAVVGAAREMRADLPIIARARDTRQAQRLYDLGASDAVPETVEASLQLAESVLVETGVPMGLIIASVHERRDEFRKQLNRPDALGGRTRRARRAAG
ncbi:MAG: cation:proton antiporter [Phenylobacterium sp.]|nr:cation:proton antiporter [Phenylobacterium sp.]